MAEEEVELKSKEGVELFSTGVWNGDKYTHADLDEMIRGFNDNKETLKPFLKLGHNKDQKLLSDDGLPAAGWIDNLRREGEKLVGDFIDVPKKIFELLERKAYRKVSSEIYWNVNINGKFYKRFLSAVALLGSDMPAVGNLSDILGLYGIKDFQAIKNYANNEKEYTIKTYSFSDKQSKEDKEMEDKVKQLEADKLKLEAEAKKFAADQDAKDAELKAARDQVAAMEVEKKDAEHKAFIKELEAEKLLTPAMKPYVEALIGEDKKEYSFEDKKLSKLEVFKSVLKLHQAADVNLDENSEAGENVGEDKESALDKKIAAYSKEHDVTYGDAYKAVLADSETDNLDEEDEDDE